MKRIISVITLAILLVCLVGCGRQDAVLDETKAYESRIKELTKQ